MKLTLDPGAAALLDALHTAGYAAYAVGGCVRDSLLGRTAHDWDLCTSALPQQVMELFGTEQCIPTGLQHGTVTIKYGGQLYETTTFRTEGSYTDGRHPDEVQFVPDVREDLARRGRKTCRCAGLRCWVRWARPTPAGCSNGCAAPTPVSRRPPCWCGKRQSRACAEVSPRTVRWGGTLLPQAVGRAMEWPDSCPRRKLLHTPVISTFDSF